MILKKIKADYLPGFLALTLILQVPLALTPIQSLGFTFEGQGKMVQVNNSLFPIETNPAAGTTVDDLFPIKSGIVPAPQPIANGSPQINIGNQQPKPNVIGSTSPISNGGGSGVRYADTKPEFRCNLFENTDVMDVLSAINSLNQAVGSVSCGVKTINVQSVQDNNKKIADAMKALSSFNQTPENIRTEDSSVIVNNVDVAIRAANALATTFASVDFFDKDCQDQMSSGDVALALNDIINGLTPFALMAATATGGTAAIPFIVGGAEITGALSSVNKIITENAVKIREASVRRAIVENTCQFIRLDQKYKFLIKNRDEQITQILKEITSSQKLFSANVQSMSNLTSTLVTKENALNTETIEIENQLASAKAQFALDKAFIAATTDELKICQMGIQLAEMKNESQSYVSSMLGSLDRVFKLYGFSSVAEYKSLKLSGKISIKNLMEYSTKSFNFNTDFSSCAKSARSFVETIEQSASLSSQIMKSAQSKVEKELKSSPDYGAVKTQLDAMNQKQLHAERLTDSLENLRQYANTFAQSEIDSELDRLRKGLFGQKVFGQNSPVMAWFDFVAGLHKASVSKFNAGLNSLRLKAYAMTQSGKSTLNSSFQGLMLNIGNVNKDWDDSYKLKNYDSEHMSIGSREYKDACREMQDVWNRWVISIDHLSAIEAFCNMIDPYIYDNRTEDQALVQMCRGFHNLGSSSAQGIAVYFAQDKNSKLEMSKQALIRDQSSNWAQLLKQKLDGLACPKPGPNF